MKNVLLAGFIFSSSSLTALAQDSASASRSNLENVLKKAATLSTKELNTEEITDNQAFIRRCAPDLVLIEQSPDRKSILNSTDKTWYEFALGEFRESHPGQELMVITRDVHRQKEIWLYGVDELQKNKLQILEAPLQSSNAKNNVPLHIGILNLEAKPL